MKKFASLIIILSIISLNLSLTPRALATDIDDLLDRIVDSAQAIDDLDSQLIANENLILANGDELSKITQELRELRVDLRRLYRYDDESFGSTIEEVKERIRSLKNRSRTLRTYYQQAGRAITIIENDIKREEGVLRKLIRKLAELRGRGGQGGAQFLTGERGSKGVRALAKAKDMLLRISRLKPSVVLMISRVGAILLIIETYANLAGIALGLGELGYALARCAILEQWNRSRPATERISRRWNERTADWCKRLEDEFRRAIEWETALERGTVVEMPDGTYIIEPPFDWPPQRHLQTPSPQSLLQPTL